LRAVLGFCKYTSRSGCFVVQQEYSRCAAWRAESRRQRVLAYRTALSHVWPSHWKTLANDPPIDVPSIVDPGGLVDHTNNAIHVMRVIALAARVIVSCSGYERRIGKKSTDA